MTAGQGGCEELRRQPLSFLKASLSLQYLEWREKQYDLRVRVDVFGRDSSEVPTVKGALTYIASADRARNLNYAGGFSAPSVHTRQQLQAPKTVVQHMAASGLKCCGTTPSGLQSGHYSDA